MGPRRRGRELAFQVLYQMDLGDSAIAYALKHFNELGRAKPEAAAFAKKLAKAAAAKQEESDALISSLAKNWDLKRLSSVDRALLRLGAYEIRHSKDVPAEVAINECIELAKAYGTDDSPGFVNGILDQVKKLSEDRPAAPKKRAKPKA